MQSYTYPSEDSRKESYFVGRYQAFPGVCLLSSARTDSICLLKSSWKSLRTLLLGVQCFRNWLSDHHQYLPLCHYGSPHGHGFEIRRHRPPGSRQDYKRPYRTPTDCQNHQMLIRQWSPQQEHHWPIWTFFPLEHLPPFSGCRNGRNLWYWIFKNRQSC